MVRVAVLGHRGMLGRRVMEVFPDALTVPFRYECREHDMLLDHLETMNPDWVINCIGATSGDHLWCLNAVLPHRLAHRWRLIQPSTDHVWDDSEYARSKRLGEVGHVIRCAIVDPDGGMLLRAKQADTYGERYRQWNGVTAKTWARIAADVVGGKYTGTLMPGSPTISHYELLDTARRIFDWPTKTIESKLRTWHAAPPNLMTPPIDVQLGEYV